MRKRFKVGMIGLLAATAVLVVVPAYADEGSCARTTDVDAFVIRDLQSRLMVAGLACGQRAAYNSFVAVHQKDLSRAGQKLRDYFISQAQGTRSLDRHVTRAANAASRRHSENRDAFCAQTAQLFRQLVGESVGSLTKIAYAASLKSVPKPVACMAKAPTAVDASNQTN